MKKVKKTKKIKSSILNGDIKVCTGSELIAKEEDRNNPEKVIEVMENTDCILGLANGRYFLVSVKRYEKVSKQIVNPIQEAPVAHSKPTAQPLKIAKVETVWEHREKFVATFPSLSADFDAFRKVIGDGSLTCCTANAKKAELVAKAVDIYRKSDGIAIPDDLKKLLDPSFSRQLAMTMTPKPPAGAMAIDRQGALLPARHSHQSDGYRPTCLDCVRKHIAQAIILLQEAEIPEYKNHFWLGLGHIAEAESESLSSYPALANTLRDHRLAMMADREYKPDLTDLFEVVDTTEQTNG